MCPKYLTLVNPIVDFSPRNVERDAQIVCEGILCDLEVFVNRLKDCQGRYVVVNSRSWHILSINLWNKADAPESSNGILQN